MREFGQYRIEALIGRGGMGEVHRAYDTRRDREVALKLLPNAFSEDADFQRRFRRESYTVARLREPHVIPIHDYGEIDDQLYIDMRLVDGRSLAVLLAEDGAMPPSRAITLLVQVAEALDAAHADGLVHRDIKPSNILVTANDFVYVVDFGIAHAIGHTRSGLTMTGATLGTLDYMAPERFENRSVDPRTDVYSLGCVLFECLTGTKPFPGGDLPSLMYGHLFVEPPRPSERVPGVSAAFDAVIARSLAKNLEERFGTAGELAAAARAALVNAEPHAATGDVVLAPAAVGAGGPTAVLAASADRPDAGAVTSVGGAYPAPGALPVPNHQPAFAGAAGGPAAPRPTPAPRPPAHPSGIAGSTVAVPLAPPPNLPPPNPPPASTGTSGGSRRTVIVLAGIAIVAVLVAVSTLVVVLSGDDVGGPNLGPLAPVAGPSIAGQKPAVGNSIAKPTIAATIPVGPTPGYMEIAPNGKFAYIANRGAGVITVFDTTRNQAVGTIPVPDGGPQFIAFSPDGTRAYVSIFNNERTVNHVGVLDTATNKFVATVPTGVRPFALDVTPDGKRVYVPNHDSGTITVIDAATNTVTQDIKVAANPHWLDISDDGTRLYAANHESNLVSTIDPTTNAVLATVAVGASPHSIVVHPRKPVVINANYDGNSVTVIDRNTGAVVATTPTGSHPQDVTLSADGKYAYLVTVDDNAIQVMDTTTYQITASVPTGKSPTSIAVAPDGRQAYVTNLNDGSVTVLNVAGTA